MHRALRIPEILLIIFKHVFRPPHLQTVPDIQHNSEMVVLARTCHTFKEPALDVLWSVLSSLSAIVRCVPRAIYAEPLFQQDGTPSMFYSALTEDEWRILRDYTSRIRVIRSLDSGLALDPVPENLFGQNLLFPNLRELNLLVSHHGISPWLRQQYIPSLDSINICSSTLGQPSFIRDCIAPLSELYPNLTKITMKGSGIGIWSQPQPSTDSVYSWPWKDLRILDCPNFKLEMDDLKHLTLLPSLIRLTFALSNAEDIVTALSSEPSALVFPSLKDLKLSYYCRSLELTSSFFAKVELPAVQQLVVHADGCLTKDIGPFLSVVQEACKNHRNGPINVLQSIRLSDVSLLQIAERWHNEASLNESDMQTLHTWTHQRSLGLDDLLPSMAFTNIRHIELDVVAHVHLTDGALLHLVSAWPFLEHLSINETTGWNRSGSVDGRITLDGLQKLLLKCPLLNHIGLVLWHTPTADSNTEVAVQSIPTSYLNSRPKFGETFYINVMDSIIESELSIPVIATFLACVASRYDDFELEAWSTFSCRLYSETEETVNRALWNDVENAVNDILGRSESGAGDQLSFIS